MGSHMVFTFLFGLWLVAVPQKTAKQPAHPEAPTASRADSGVLENAQTLLGEGKFKLAEDVLQPYVQQHPNDASGHLLLAFAEGGLGERRRALNDYKAGISAAPQNFSAQLNYGVLLLQDGQAAEAVPHLRAAVQAKPSSIRAQMNLGTALRATGDRTGAVAAFECAVRLAPQVPQTVEALVTTAHECRQWASAERTLDWVLAQPGLTASNRQRYTFLLAEVLLHEKKDTAARQIIDNAPVVTPSEAAEIHRQLASHALAAGDKRSAAVDLAQALALQPDSDSNRADLAQLQMDNGAYTQACANYRVLTRKQPNAAQWHAALGDCLLRNKEFLSARSELETATHLDAGDALAWRNLAFAAYKGHDPQTSLGALQRYQRLAPQSAAQDAGAAFLQAVDFDTLQQYIPAQQAYETFLKLDRNRDPDDDFKARHRLIYIQLVLHPKRR